MRKFLAFIACSALVYAWSYLQSILPPSIDHWWVAPTFLLSAVGGSLVAYRITKWIDKEDE